jgi:trypsin
MPRRLIQSLILTALAGAIFAGTGSSALRVVGGTPIQIQSAPWSVFVEYNAGATQYDCTGSVIDALHVLTAAHCLYGSPGSLAPASALSVKAGISNVATPAATDVEQDRSVSSFRVHPGYVSNGTEVPDDIAVLTLATPLDLSGPAVRAVALPAPGATFPAGAAVTIAGFGQQDATADPSGQLDSMTATTYSQGECGQQQGAGFDEFNGIFICSASPASSVCHGDSGGGVVTARGTQVLIGVVGYAITGCRPGSQNIYTYVGAPEILRFIRGDAKPPVAPRPSVVNSWQLTWKPPLVVGNTLTCTAGKWPGPIKSAYTFLNAVTGKVLQTGPQATYALLPKVLRATIVCDVAVTNSGGTTLVKTLTTPKIGPALHTKSKS